MGGLFELHPLQPPTPLYGKRDPSLSQWQVAAVVGGRFKTNRCAERP